MSGSANAAALRIHAAGATTRATFAHIGYLSATAHWPVPDWARPVLGPGLMLAGFALAVGGFRVKSRSRWRGALLLVAAAVLLGTGLVLRSVLMEPYEVL